MSPPSRCTDGGQLPYDDDDYGNRDDRDGDGDDVGRGGGGFLEARGDAYVPGILYIRIYIYIKNI